MPDLVSMLRRLADLYEEEEKGESSAALEKRIADLEAAAKSADPDDRADALEELSDEEWDLIQTHRASLTSPPPEKREPEPKADEPEPKKKTRPGRRPGQAYTWTVDDEGKVQRVDIPTIYNGPDEGDEVELPDDDAADAA